MEFLNISSDYILHIVPSTEHVQSPAVVRFGRDRYL